MDDDFISWDDLDLDDVLGERNWTDGEDEAENEVIWGHESEWESDDHDGEIDAMPVVTESVASAEKENGGNEPVKKRVKSSNRQYQCPLCKKQYKSTSGFRGHVLKKHDRADLKAHQHILDADQHVDNNQPATQKAQNLPVPITTRDDLEKEMETVVKTALQEIANDGCHALPTSKFGQTMILIATQLLVANLACLCLFLLDACVPIMAPQSLDIPKLRLDQEFLEGFFDILLPTMDFQLELRLAKLFVHRFLTAFTNAYYKRQIELMDINRKQDIATINDNDKQVIYYLCGFIINAMRKRYFKYKTKGPQLQVLLNLLICDGAGESSASKWTDGLDRGGLKRPSEKFFILMLQVERWVRDIVQMGNLNSDSLVNLREQFILYPLLRTSWANMFSDNNDKWILLEHILGLFLKIRGIAVTKLLRKQLQQQRKASKIAAGSRKALRKELKQLSSNN